jgi:hypothetical protein
MARAVANRLDVERLGALDDDGTNQTWKETIEVLLRWGTPEDAAS